MFVDTPKRLLMSDAELRDMILTRLVVEPSCRLHERDLVVRRGRLGLLGAGAREVEHDLHLIDGCADDLGDELHLLP